MLDKLKLATKSEPVVAIGIVLGVLQSAWSDISGELDAGAGWRAVLLAVGVYVMRHFATPAWKAARNERTAFAAGVAARSKVDTQLTNVPSPRDPRKGG